MIPLAADSGVAGRNDPVNGGVPVVMFLVLITIFAPVSGAHFNPAVTLADAEGLIGFPSYHTVMAILTTYAVRGIRRLFWPVAIWNALVIIAVPVDGAHNICDVAAGMLVAWGSIAVAHRLLVQASSAAAAGSGDPAPAAA